MNLLSNESYARRHFRKDLADIIVYSIKYILYNKID